MGSDWMDNMMSSGLGAEDPPMNLKLMFESSIVMLEVNQSEGPYDLPFWSWTVSPPTTISSLM
jgi:hypothetical protein